MSETLIRRTLTDDASDRLREWILDGRLSPDDDLSEPQLAEMLGISRTPLRAAIGRLHHEGLLDVETGRGFRVARVDAALVREIYPILAALEAMALRLSAPGSLPDAGELRKLNAQIAAETRRPRLFALDREFHRLLSAGCPNPRLLELLEHHRRLATRVDGAGRRGMHNREGSRDEHEAIIDDVEHRRIDRAARRIERHYLDGIEVVIDWMSQQKP
jgi:DNA-binding GntR family transcriptional regulator